MNIYALSGLINAILVSFLGIFVYAKNKNNDLNKTYSLFCFFVAFWSYGYFFWQSSNTYVNAIFWCRILMAGAIFIPVSFLHFSLILLELYQRKKNIVRAGYLIFLVFFFLNFTTLFIKDVVPRISFKFWPLPGTLFLPFLIIWLSYCIYPCYLLFKKYKTFTGFKRNQVKYVLSGIIIGYVSGSTNYFLWYDIPILPFGNFIVPLFVGLMAYAIIKYHLMDIRVVLTRASIFLIVYAFVLGLPFWIGYKLLGTNLWYIPIASAVVLATAGPVIYQYFRRRAEGVILKEQKQYQRALKEISSSILLIKELDLLLKTVSQKIVDTVNLAWAGIYLKNEKEKTYILKYFYCGDGGVNSQSLYLPQKIDDFCDLIEAFYSERRPLIGEELKFLTTTRISGAGLVVPCFMGEQLLGFLFLGNKSQGRMYSQDDTIVFEVLSNDISLAIENCLFWQEEKTRLAREEQIRRQRAMDICLDIKSVFNYT